MLPVPLPPELVLSVLKTAAWSSNISKPPDTPPTPPTPKTPKTPSTPAPGRLGGLVNKATGILGGAGQAAYGLMAVKSLFEKPPAQPAPETPKPATRQSL